MSCSDPGRVLVLNDPIARKNLANLEIVSGSHVWHVSAAVQRPMVHYPTMLQRGCTLYVVYSVMFKENATPEAGGLTTNRPNDVESPSPPLRG